MSYGYKINSMDSAQLLLKLVNSDNIPHALLLTGLDVPYKKEVALAVIRKLLCLEVGDIAVLKHPDFYLVDESPVRIEQIRNLKHKFSVSSYLAGKKVALILDAGSMRIEAANSFLKILEEPPTGAVFILLAPYRSSVLKTVASRVFDIRISSPRSNTHEKFSVEGLEKCLSAIKIFENGTLSEKFSEAKKYSLQNKSELLDVLDAWLIRLHKLLMLDFAAGNVFLIKKIITIKRSILATNVNPQLLLEEMFFEQHA